MTAFGDTSICVIDTGPGEDQAEGIVEPDRPVGLVGTRLDVLVGRVQCQVEVTVAPDEPCLGVGDGSLPVLEHEAVGPRRPR